MATKHVLLDAIATALHRLGLRLSFHRPVRDPLFLFATKCHEFGVQTVLDVGANVGQFGRALRAQGYGNRIVSFEPLAAAHAALEKAARRDERWTVAPRAALGDRNYVSSINVSRNLASSSLLEVTELSVRAEPVSAFIGTEQAQVRRLDDLVADQFAAPFAMKLDTQGFELHVLRGAPRTLERTELLMVEMSLAPLYVGGARFVDLYASVERANFRCISLTQGFVDNKRHELLQVDGIFVRV